MASRVQELESQGLIKYTSTNCCWYF